MYQIKSNAPRTHTNHFLNVRLYLTTYQYKRERKSLTENTYPK